MGAAEAAEVGTVAVAAVAAVEEEAQAHRWGTLVEVVAVVAWADRAAAGRR